MNRRSFLRSTAATGASLAFPGSILGAAGSDEAGDINVALLGAGAQGEVLLTACLKMRAEVGVRFRAVCDVWEDLNLSRIVKLLGRYGHEVNGYVDYQEMLAQEKTLDAVIVATPDFCHAEQAKACLGAGLHVYCEAPMSNTSDGARRMVQAARDSGKLLQIGQQRRSNPRYQHCRTQLLNTVGLLGRLTAVNGQWHHPARSDRGWSRRRALDEATLAKHGYASMHQFKNWMWYQGLGAGPVVDFGVHQIDVINWFLGTPPKTITARGGTYYYDPKTHQWYDTAMAILEYETGDGVVSVSYETLCTNGYGGHVEVFMGDQGTLELSESPSRGGVYRDPEAPDWRKWVRLGLLNAPGEEAKPPATAANIDVAETRPPAKYDIPVTVDVPYHQPHLQNFFAAVRGQAQLNCSAETAYASTLTALKINDAVEKRQTLELVPDTFRI
ncbi:MAG: Gfo/Idh/MocA family oxidoreductase [Phycisphaerales bacterium]|nr:MAG: Gfo/Idh/MocA family oxidoreductase [Phycisphaerales bacterium]